jgi:tripartite-type tricarboxylate transporter receptor subunit TctC|tara:strand:- start:37776 stop:38876 length:1101 start_codon:yes stop_codon:yes gene_type:complete
MSGSCDPAVAVKVTVLQEEVAMSMMKTIKMSGAVLVMSLGMAHAVSAQTAEEFYSGSPVTIMVSAPAGTLSDVLARQFAIFFSRHIPGEPDIIVMNVAGAGGMVAAGQLQNNQPADGSVIGFLQRNNLYRSLVDGTNDTFDPREVEWIGSLNKEKYAIVASEQSPVQTADDMFTTPMVIGATGFANENRTLAALMNDHLGTQFDIIHGYSGREEVYLAMERGEVDGWLPTITGLITGDQARQVAEGEMTVLMQLGWENDPAFPDLPNFSDYVEDPEVEALIDFLILPFEAGRPLAVPAGVPEDRVAVLRDAFTATMEDPEFMALMEEAGSPLEPISGAEIATVVGELYATPESTLEDVRTLVTATD